METRWLIFIIFKKDNALAVLLNDNPRKYKYNPHPMMFEDVLFQVDMYQMNFYKFYFNLHQTITLLNPILIPFYTRFFSNRLMKTSTKIFAIVALVAVFALSAIVYASPKNAFADKDGIPNENSQKSCIDHPDQKKCGDNLVSDFRVKPVEGWKR